MTAPPRVTFRPIEDDDLPFLARLYASTREAELAQVPWTEQQKKTFLAQQFEAQHTFYSQQFADADLDLLLVDGEPGGRLYLDRREAEIRIVDIALLPEHRGRGLGESLLRAVLDEAAGRGVPVRIHVEQFNPALRLYRRLGFRHIEDQGPYYLMEWRPDPDPAS